MFEEKTLLIYALFIHAVFVQALFIHVGLDACEYS